MKLWQLLLCWLLSFSPAQAGTLLDAVWAHDAEKVKSELKQHPESVNETDKDGVTALMYAVKDGDTDIVKLLIDAKANVNAKDNRGNTALMHYVLNKINYAVHKREEQARTIVELLLKAGANQSMKNNDNKTWQDLENESRQSIDAVITRAYELKKDTDKAHQEIELKKLIKAIEAKNLTEAQKILNDNPGIANETDSEGMTPLMHAVGEAGSPRGYIEATTQKDTYLKIAKMLIKAGAKLNTQDKRGRTAIFIAAEEKRPVAIRLLHSLGADVDISDQDGNTPLMISPQTKVTNYLITAQAKLNIQNKLGETALMRAVLKNSAPMVTALVEAGADVTLKNKNGKTALDLAKTIKRGSVIAGMSDSEIESILKKSVSKK